MTPLRPTPSRARACVAIVVGLGITAGVSALVAPAGASSAASAHHRPGRVVDVESLPDELWLPGTGSAYRLGYTSTSFDGEPTVVSGAVFVPEGEAPRRGWPVLSWAHGTVGVADVCAPSTAGRSPRDIAYLSAWLQAGYAIVATDYQGLGTPGPHPYLDGGSEAYATIDIVRAARRVDRSLGRRWMAVGQSQGAHASLFAASFANDYAPNLEFRGAIATGLPSQWRTTAAAAGVFVPEAPANPLVIDILAGLHATQPDSFDPGAYLTPTGADVYDRALADECFPARAAAVAGLQGVDLFDIDATEQEDLLQLLEAEEIPIDDYDRPVFIAQGTADRVVYPPASATTAQLLDEAGTDVTFRFYPGADHNSTLEAALPDLLAFASGRFER